MKTILRANAMPISQAWAIYSGFSFHNYGCIPWSTYKNDDRGESDSDSEFHGWSECFINGGNVCLSWSDHHSAFNNNNKDYWEKEDKRQFDELTDKIDFKF